MLSCIDVDLIAYPQVAFSRLSWTRKNDKGMEDRCSSHLYGEID